MCPADALPRVAGAGAICALEDIPANGAREFQIGEGEWPLRGFVVRDGDAVHAWLNRCPHAGHALNLSPDDFYAPDGRLLICRSHGAKFERATGRCVGGPCTGASLRRIRVELVAGEVRLGTGSDVLAPPT
ncbi:MAG: Rieske (2Fe-2S) protein [Pseudomonadota bacterium]